MANQCFYNGNFYQAIAATAAGESPATTPDKWSLVKIPARFRWVLGRLTYANLLELDGQKDKADAEHTSATGDDRVGLDQMIRTEANRERSLERPQVRVRPVV